MRHYVAMSVYLTAAFAILMTIGLLALNEPILRMMNFSAEIMPDVTAYMRIIYAGLIVTASYNSLAAFLRALGDSRSPLYFLIISAMINVVLDIVFIVCFGMGVDGCAYATVIAQGISALLCFYYIVKKFPILHLKKRRFSYFFFEFRKTSVPWTFRWDSSFPLLQSERSLCRARSIFMVRYIWQDFPPQERCRISFRPYSLLLERHPRLMSDRTEVPERWIGKNRGEIYPDYDLDLECDHHVCRIFLRQIT